MHLLDHIDDGHLLGSHDGEQTWQITDDQGHRKVLRICRFTEQRNASNLDALLAPQVDGVAAWHDLLRLNDDLRHRLGLGDGDWLGAVRDWVPGVELADTIATLTTGWKRVAARIAMALRNLHAHDWCHGDLQPRNVIVDDDQQPWLIDLAPIPPGPSRPAVAGSAALMAPELWQGASATPASDVYALCALVSWMAAGGRFPLHADDLAEWAGVHHDAEPRLADALDGRLRGVIERGLAKRPDDRPVVQTIIDALTDELPDLAPPYVSLPTSLYRPLQREIVDGLQTHHSLLVVGPDASGKSLVLKRVFRQLRLQGSCTLLYRSGRIYGPHLDQSTRVRSHHGPWAPVRCLIDAVTADDFAPDFGDVTGDRLHVFQMWTNRLLDAVADEPLVILWDDLDDAGPDIRDFWTHVVDVISRRDEQVRFIATARSDFDVDATHTEVAVPQFDADDWNRWRTDTPVSEIRDIPAGRWRTLVERLGDQPVRLFAAINREIGTTSTPDFAHTHQKTAPTPTADNLVDGRWKAHLAELMSAGAYAQAAETCETLYPLLSSASDDDELPLLQIWLDALVYTGLDSRDVDHFDNALAQTAEGPPARPDALLLRARLFSELGRYDEGLQLLDDLDDIDDELDDTQWIEGQRWRAQLSLSSGQFDDARAAAEQGLEFISTVDDPPHHAYCHLSVVDRGARAMTGDEAAIEQLRDFTPRLDHPDVAAELRARCHAYRAIGLTRCDQLDEATDAHLRALEEIESNGLVGQLPTYLLNVGTAYHRQGRLGLAREYYSRGSRLAHSTTRPSTRALLWANEANIDIALGRLDEADELVERASAIAEQHQLDPIAVMCRSLAGDIALERNQPQRAIQIYSEALEQPGIDDRRRASLLLYSAEASLRAGRAVDALDRLNQARHLIEQSRLTDLEHHHGIVRARLQWTDGGNLGPMAGIEMFRRHLLAAADNGNHRLVLRQSPRLWRRLEHEELTGVMREIAELVHRSKHAIAMGLTKSLRADFFSQLPDLPSPQQLDDEPTDDVSAAKQRPETSVQTGDIDDELREHFYRMLSLNEMILNLDSLDQLWDRAIDIALELSGAERGYLLMRDPSRSRVGDYRITASRDLAGDEIPRPHLKVSRTIAEEAASTGRTVVTINARDDRRFDTALSVVDLDLTSVLCVPVRDASGLLGALYLDHRFEAGVFGGEIPRMMEAFAHQIAVGVTSARRLQALRREKSRLAEANERLDALLEQRESALSKLEQRCDSLTDQIELQRRRASEIRDRFPDIAFVSTPMQKLLDRVDRVAGSDIPVVVTGESGVGKELVATAVHHRSQRRDAPFVAFNCSAISENLFASEMFGHIKGAFTGARADRSGLFQAADGGTLFLDEVGEMPMSMQSKLLRALQQKRIRPVGAAEEIDVDVRIVAATNRRLEEMVDEGTFRQDLYFRLAGLVVDVPPLRDRPEDIPVIARHLLSQIAADSDRPAPALSPDAARALMEYRWPGNVRQLENTLRAACALGDTDEIGPETLAGILGATTGSRPTRKVTSHSPRRRDPRGRKPKATRPDVVEALRRHGDDLDAAADALDVSTRTLYRYLDRYSIEL